MAKFRPGRSGNPRGRPKGARNVSTHLLAEVNAPAAEGQPMTRLQATIRAHVEKAMGGDGPAVRDVLQRIEKIEAGMSAERAPPFTEADREAIAEIGRRLSLSSGDMRKGDARDESGA